MAKIRVGLIRVISNLEQAQIHGRILEQAFPMLVVSTRLIDGFPDGLYNKILEQQAVPEILKAAQTLAAHVDVIAVSCAADPGVEELRQTLSIPVVGAGSSLGAVARASGMKVGFITITPYLPYAVVQAFQKDEVEWKQVAGVHRSSDLFGALDATIQTATELLKRGCRAIGLACTGFSTMGVATVLERTFSGVLVLDPVVAMGAVITGLFGGSIRRG